MRSCALRPHCVMLCFTLRWHAVCCALCYVLCCAVRSPAAAGRAVTGCPSQQTGGVSVACRPQWRTQVLADGALLLTSFSLPLAAWSTHVVLGNQLRPGSCKGSRGWWWWCRGVVEHLWILCSPSSVVLPTQLLPLTDNCSLSCTAHVAARNQVGCIVGGAAAGGPPPSPWCERGAHVWELGTLL
jgi:hypothetical protein